MVESFFLLASVLVFISANGISVEKAASSTYHTSGGCNLWWPLNESEIFTTLSRSNTSVVSNEYTAIIFTCPDLPDMLKTYNGKNPGIGIEIGGNDGDGMRAPVRTVADISPHGGLDSYTTSFTVASPVMRTDDIFKDMNIYLSFAQEEDETRVRFAHFKIRLKIIFWNDIDHLKPAMNSLRADPMIHTLSHRDSLGPWLNSLGLGDSNAVFVEIGVNRGQLSAIILSSWTGGMYVMVDPWEETVNTLEYVDGVNQQHRRSDYELAMEVANLYPLRVKVIRNYSVSAARDMADLSVTIAYIDAAHHYKAVWDDLLAWWPKVKHGGVLAGHDYLLRGTLTTVFTVQPAVDEFARKMGLSVHTVSGEHDSSWYIFKP